MTKSGDFSVSDSLGQFRPFSSLLEVGKPALIDLWASWCGPYRTAIPKVRALHRKYSDRLQIISISLDEKREKWLQAVAEEQMEWEQWFAPGDQTQVLAEEYGVEFIPFVFVIHEGKVVAFGHPDTLDRRIASLISRQP